jgi:hypothetical protein
MTRRGSIAYYLAAAVCGSFFLAVCYFVYFQFAGSDSQHWGRDFLFLYFFAILFASLPVALGAWLLRRLVAKLDWKQAWQWLLAGTSVFLAVVWGLGRIGVALVDADAPGAVALMPLLGGPMFAALYPPWIPLPAAAATAATLFLVHRAFDEPRVEERR